jgi:hypothetical protein
LKPILETASLIGGRNVYPNDTESVDILHCFFEKMDSEGFSSLEITMLLMNIPNVTPEKIMEALDFVEPKGGLGVREDLSKEQIADGVVKILKS